MSRSEEYQARLRSVRKRLDALREAAARSDKEEMEVPLSLLDECLWLLLEQDKEPDQ
jgi:hypothetical protein